MFGRFNGKSFGDYFGDNGFGLLPDILVPITLESPNVNLSIIVGGITEGIIADDLDFVLGSPTGASLSENAWLILDLANGLRFFSTGD